MTVSFSFIADGKGLSLSYTDVCVSVCVCLSVCVRIDLCVLSWGRNRGGEGEGCDRVLFILSVSQFEIVSRVMLT